MANGVARLNDTVTGICNGPGHPTGRNFTGTWTTCSGTTRADGLGVVRIGDTGVTDCGHNIRATGGSSRVKADGIYVHRIGDAVEVIEGGNGTTQTGSGTYKVD